MSFTSGKLTVDLGRQVNLGSLDIKIQTAATVAQSPKLNLKLELSLKQKQPLLPEELLQCSFGSFENYTYGFDCLGQTGRYIMITAYGADMVSILQLVDITIYENINGETKQQALCFKHNMHFRTQFESSKRCYLMLILKIQEEF